MSVSVVYWSGTGNTEAMANAVAEGITEAGGEAKLIPVSEANVDELATESAFALGCPSMGVEVLEEEEITNEKLLQTIRDLYANREQYIEAMSKSSQMDSIGKIVGMLWDCAK